MDDRTVPQKSEHDAPRLIEPGGAAEAAQARVFENLAKKTLNGKPFPTETVKEQDFLKKTKISKAARQ